MPEPWQQSGFALYVHWPFCAAKCPYCDFNSHVSARVDHSAWRELLVAELRRAARDTPGRVLRSIFFGGGTPSLMEPETVAAVIRAAQDAWTPANSIEITLEANPGSVEAGRFAAYRDAGVNRISMGIQALDDADLRRLGRIHSVAEARKAFDIARQTFERVSFDLIYARQSQTLSAWERELQEALSMAADHLSLYQLTIEDGTAFGDRLARGGLRGLPGEDLAADMYLLTQEICEAAGMPRYEVSNHARPGAESRHNIVYWQGGDYVGIGPGAHGRVSIGPNRYATECAMLPEAWLDSARHGSAEIARTCISRAEQAEEYLMMGLRMREGIDANRYAEIAGVRLDPRALHELETSGLIRQHQGRVAATIDGTLVLNQVIARLA